MKKLARHSLTTKRKWRLFAAPRATQTGNGAAPTRSAWRPASYRKWNMADHQSVLETR